jgi:hypothetical protein
MVPGQLSYMNCDVVNMKPVEEIEGKYNYLNINSFTKWEIWILKQPNIIQKSFSKSVTKESNLIRVDLFNNNEVLNYYRSMPVYNIPAAYKVQHLQEMFFKEQLKLMNKATQEDLDANTSLLALSEIANKHDKQLGIIDIEFDFKKYSELRKSGVLFNEGQKAKYSPLLSIF